jgi:hypothetical protein
LIEVEVFAEAAWSKQAMGKRRIIRFIMVGRRLCGFWCVPKNESSLYSICAENESTSSDKVIPARSKPTQNNDQNVKLIKHQAEAGGHGKWKPKQSSIEPPDTGGDTSLIDLGSHRENSSGKVV